LIVDLEAAAIVRLEAGRGEIKGTSGSHPSGGEERHIGDDPFPRFEQDHHLSGRALADVEALHGLIGTEDHVTFPHLVDQLIDDFVVQELERTPPLLDQGYLYPKRSKDRGILDPDNAGAYDGQASGNTR